jgi:hypothetical protein
MCHRDRDANRVVGTVVGAGLGALLGAGIAGHHDRAAGAVIGGVGGGLAGNAIGGSTVHCDRYDNGYYDRDGRWHYASGYYDRYNRWVVATPGRGYFDSDGRWIPVAASAEYRGADAAYVGGGLNAREDRIEERIRSAESEGALSRYDADRDYRYLNDIRDRQAMLANDHDGLNAADRDEIARRLNRLSDRLNAEDAGGY